MSDNTDSLIDERIDALRRGGMHFNDIKNARIFLRRNTQHKLRPYLSKFIARTSDGGIPMFVEGTTFEDVVAVYDFDDKLRECVQYALKKIEAALSGEWAQRMESTYGPYGYLDHSLYRSQKNHKRILLGIANSMNKKHKINAAETALSLSRFPPVDEIAEMISFGTLSKFIKNLRSYRDRKSISEQFDVTENVLCSFLENSTVLRNKCAHNRRIWNAKLNTDFIKPTNHAGLLVAMEGAKAHRLHNTLLMIDHLYLNIHPDNNFRENLLELIDSCPLVDPIEMGFPTKWRECAYWNVRQSSEPGKRRNLLRDGQSIHFRNLIYKIS